MTYLLKLHKESMMFSFQNNYAQKQIIKLHKFLTTNVKSYVAEFPVENYEVKSNNIAMGDGSTDKLIPQRVFSIKSHLDEVRSEYSFMYILGKADDSMIEAKKELMKEPSDLGHLLQNTQQPFYGFVSLVETVPRI